MRLDSLTPEADAFLRGTRLATIVTHREPYPHAVPVWFDWTGQALEFYTRPDRPKVARLTSDPRVSALVSAEVDEPVYWVRVEGEATISDDAADLVERLCDRYLDLTDPGGAAFKAEMLAMADTCKRVTIRPDRLWHFAG